MLCFILRTGLGCPWLTFLQHGSEFCSSGLELVTMGAQEQHSRLRSAPAVQTLVFFSTVTVLRSPESWNMEEKRANNGCHWSKEAARLRVKLSECLTTSVALCLIRSVFFKDVLDKVVTRSFCAVNPSRAGSNYRLHWASRMQQTFTAPFFEGWFFF